MMADQSAADPVEQFIRDHRDRFNREQLVDQLLRAGHDPDAIAAAMARVEAGGDVLADAPRPRQQGIRIFGALLAVVCVGASWLGLSSWLGAVYLQGSLAPAFAVGVAVVGAATMAWLAGRLDEPGCLILIAVIVLLPIAILGTCVAAVAWR